MPVPRSRLLPGSAAPMNPIGRGSHKEGTAVKAEQSTEGTSTRRQVFITGGTGYLGTRLVPKLLERGHMVRALARRQAVGKLPAGCAVIAGDLLDSTTFMTH